MKKLLVAGIFGALTLSLNASAQVYNWGPFTSFSQSGTQVHLGGTSARQGVGAVVLNNQFYVSYTNSDGTIWLTSSAYSSGYSLSPGNEVSINGAAEYTDNNTALATDGTYLFLAFIDPYGELQVFQSPANPFGTTFTWTGLGNFEPTIGCCQLSPLIYSPSLAVMNVNGTSTLFISATGSDRSLWLGQMPVGLGLQQASWSNTANTNIGMSPGLGVFNNVLYIAFPTNANSHDLYYYTTTGNGVLTYHTSAAGDSSSTSPSLLAFQGYLYMAFRTNDGDHKFIYKWSSDGNNWSSSRSISGVTMGGPPALADGTNLQLDPGHIINAFSANDSSHYLYSGESQ